MSKNTLTDSHQAALEGYIAMVSFSLLSTFVHFLPFLYLYFPAFFLLALPFPRLGINSAASLLITYDFPGVCQFSHSYFYTLFLAHHEDLFRPSCPFHGLGRFCCPAELPK